MLALLFAISLIVGGERDAGHAAVPGHAARPAGRPVPPSAARRPPVRATAAACSARANHPAPSGCGSWTAGSPRPRSSNPRPRVTNVRSPPDEADAVMAVPADRRPHTVNLGVHGDYRVAAVPQPGGDVLVTGLPLAGVQTTVWRLISVEVVVAAVGLLLAGLVGTAIVRLSLRPLRRVAATAGRVAELPLARGEVSLSERVPDADTDPPHRGGSGRRRAEPDARPRRRRAGRPAGQRDARAAVRRRRQPRAAHPAGRDPGLRRADPAQSRRGPTRRRRTRWSGSSRRAPG